MDSKYFEY